MNQKYDPNRHHRRSIRLKGYDYSMAGAYFVTICSRHMICYFGHVEDGVMICNDAGEMVNREWLALAERFANIAFGPFITMPNHFHAILIILEFAGAYNVYDQLSADADLGHPQGVPLQSSLDEIIRGADGDDRGRGVLGNMIGAFKSITTNQYIEGVKSRGWQPFERKFWQRNFYEHIIRDEAEYLKIAEYIKYNPVRWEDDTYFI